MKLYNCNGEAGCVSRWRSRETGTIAAFYHAEQAGLDASAGPYVSVCIAHGQMVARRSQNIAREHRSPAEWCTECAGQP